MVNSARLSAAAVVEAYLDLHTYDTLTFNIYLCSEIDYAVALDGEIILDSA